MKKTKGNLPNPLGRTLGLVHGNQHGNHTNTPTGEDTTRNEEREGLSGGLHGDTNGEDGDSEDDGPSPAEDICGGSGEKSTKKCTSGQDGDDEGLLGCGDGARPGGGIEFTEDAQPVLHGLDTGDDTGIVTEEDTTKGGKEGLHGERWSRRGVHDGREMKRTERTPAHTSLGALAPRPSPVTTAPPGMIERKVLVCGER